MTSTLGLLSDNPFEMIGAGGQLRVASAGPSEKRAWVNGPARPSLPAAPQASRTAASPFVDASECRQGGGSSSSIYPRELPLDSPSDRSLSALLPHRRLIANSGDLPAPIMPVPKLCWDDPEKMNSWRRVTPPTSSSSTPVSSARVRSKTMPITVSLGKEERPRSLSPHSLMTVAALADDQRKVSFSDEAYEADVYRVPCLATALSSRQSRVSPRPAWASVSRASAAVGASMPPMCKAVLEPSGSGKGVVSPRYATPTASRLASTVAWGGQTARCMGCDGGRGAPLPSRSLGARRVPEFGCFSPRERPIQSSERFVDQASSRSNRFPGLRCPDSSFFDSLRRLDSDARLRTRSRSDDRSVQRSSRSCSPLPQESPRQRRTKEQARLPANTVQGGPEQVARGCCHLAHSVPSTHSERGCNAASRHATPRSTERGRGKGVVSWRRTHASYACEPHSYARN